MKSTTTLKTVMGPLWNVFSDEKTYEVIIDSFDDVYWERNQKLEESKKIFKNAAELNAFVTRILKAAKQPTGKAHYVFNLDEKTRVNVVLPPLAIRGPAVNIMKIPNQNFTLEDLLNWKAVDEKGKKFLESALANHRGILVAGIAGSGKTTLLNMLFNSIALPERVVTLEHASELISYREKVCRLKTENSEPEEMVGLIKVAHRMRASWFVMSYLNGPEVMPFIELLRDSSTGLACITGENVSDALKRLETKALLSSDGHSLEDVRYAIAQAFPVVVVQERRPNGKRVISQMAEIEYDAGELKVKIVHKM